MRLFVEPPKETDTKIFIGSLKDAGDQELLNKNKIVVILNVCSDIDTPYRPDTILMKVGLDDPQTGLAPRNPVDTAVECLDKAELLAFQREGNVLIHCAAGQNRSALVAAIWGSKHVYGMTLKSAVAKAQVKDKKPWMIDLGYRW